ncbi:MAG: NTP transferase domain-containing protein [Deltaproteobacteria bacterium]|nr:NTP transferase domain-containing protein [Deltaproteobacteria bacterium]
MFGDGDTWAIVLAGGEGTRLASLTRALHGEPTPKQFARIRCDGDSLLEATLRRLATLVPARRTVVVIGPAHVRWAREQLRGRRAIHLLVQPQSIGTTAAILFALAWIRAHARQPLVLVMPSDHHVRRLAPFRVAIRAAARTSRATGRLTLLGVVPDSADSEYGWIVPGAAIDDLPAQLVAAFVEKPAVAHAAELRRQGALWSSFIFAAPAHELRDLARRWAPDCARAFDRLDVFSFAVGNSELADTFARLADCDFSRTVLQQASSCAVVRLAGAGWSDWGTPERVRAGWHETARARSSPSLAPATAHLFAPDLRPRGCPHHVRVTRVER